MRKESFTRAKAHIVKYLDSVNERAFTTNDISDMFEKYRDLWKIAAYRNAGAFESFLVKQNILSLYKLTHTDTGSVKTILIKEKASIYDIAQSIKKDGYIGYYSAMSINKLTEQIPKSVYINYGKTLGFIGEKDQVKSLNQESIHKAFSKSQRVTSNIYLSEIDRFKFHLVQKQYSDESIGIIEIDGVKVSDLERTLIDAAVRPAYSGGVFEVLKAFKNARETVNTILLEDYLNNLGYLYPYHQLIGFYMDRSGYSKEQYFIFLDKLSEYDFYLTYNISHKKYDQKWHIFYPKGF